MDPELQHGEVKTTEEKATTITAPRPVPRRRTDVAEDTSTAKIVIPEKLTFSALAPKQEASKDNEPQSANAGQAESGPSDSSSDSANSSAGSGKNHSSKNGQKNSKAKSGAKKSSKERTSAVCTGLTPEQRKAIRIALFSAIDTTLAKLALSRGGANAAT